MIYQDPFSSLNPVFRVRDQITETLSREPRARQERGANARDRAARRGRHPRSRAPRAVLPARAERRHAPAGDDRARDGVRAARAARRRADDGARRDDAGPDPGAADVAAREARACGAARVPRLRRDRPGVRPRRGDVRRLRRRDRHARAALHRRAASVHARAAGIGAAAGVGRSPVAAAGHCGRAARADRRAARLRVQAALSLRPAVVRVDLDGAGAGLGPPRDGMPGAPVRTPAG